MKTVALCLIATGLSMTPAAAQTLVDATDPDQIVNLVSGFGSAVLETDSVGDPMIVGRIDGTRYVVMFYGCDEEAQSCRSIQFRAAWETDGQYTAERLNAWNRDKRFAKAYLDDVDDPVLEMDVNLYEGVTARNLEDTIDWWQIALGDFKDDVLDQ